MVPTAWRLCSPRKVRINQRAERSSTAPGTRPGRPPAIPRSTRRRRSSRASRRRTRSGRPTINSCRYRSGFGLVTRCPAPADSCSRRPGATSPSPTTSWTLCSARQTPAGACGQRASVLAAAASTPSSTAASTRPGTRRLAYAKCASPTTRGADANRRGAKELRELGKPRKQRKPRKLRSLSSLGSPGFLSLPRAARPLVVIRRRRLGHALERLGLQQAHRLLHGGLQLRVPARDYFLGRVLPIEVGRDAIVLDGPLAVHVEESAARGNHGPAVDQGRRVPRADQAAPRTLPDQRPDAVVPEHEGHQVTAGAGHFVDDH